jgi:hypothetical protein
MRRGCLRGLAVAALVSAAGCARVDHQQYTRPLGPRDYKVDPSLAFHPYSLIELSRTPQEGMTLSVMAIFDRRDERIWSPMYTSFSQENYVSFSAWPPEAALWTVEGRQTSVPTFFFRKEAPHFEQLLGAERYQLVEIKGIVRSTFAERPWVEVFYVNPKSDGAVYDDDTLSRLIHGLEDAEKLPSAAIRNLEAALKGRLHTPGRVLAHRTLGALYAGQKALDAVYRWRKAWEHYDAAVMFDPSDKVAREGLDKSSRELEAARLLKRTQESKEPEQPKPPENK